MRCTQLVAGSELKESPISAVSSVLAWVTTSPAAACAPLMDDDRRADTDSALSGVEGCLHPLKQTGLDCSEGRVEALRQLEEFALDDLDMASDPHGPQPDDAERECPAGQIRSARLGCVGEELDHVGVGAFEGLDAQGGRGEADLGHGKGAPSDARRDRSPAH